MTEKGRPYTLRVPYKEFPDPQGGVLWSATLNVQIAIPKEGSPRTKRFEAAIDSGASRCIFHASIGEFIGLEIDKGPEEQTMGIAGPTATYLHDIHLYAPGGIIEIRAGFSKDLPLAGVLGMKGFFEHFRILFDPAGQCCELERVYQA